MFAARKTDGAATAAATYIEDVFSTYLYTGNGSAQTIPNSIALGSAYGGSVFFDGTGDNLKNTSAGTAFQTGTGNFTIEFWFKGGAQNPYAVIFESYVSGGANQILAIQDGGSGNSAIYVEGGNIRIATSSNPWDNVWHHHAIVRNGSIVTYYIDGVSNGTFTTAVNVTTGNSFILGEYSGGAFALNGALSNFRFVKGTAVYTSAFTPPTTPLTAITNTSLLICQSPSPTTDYSSNAFPITVTNAIAQNGGGPFTDSTANKGGMVWLKGRSGATAHALYDTARGATFDLVSNSTAAQTTQTTGLTAFNSNGFSIGALAKLNTSAATYASWTFRKQAKFFDVVTYAGNGSTTRTISHNLGSVPGFIIIKETSAAEDWCVLAGDSSGNYQYLYFNTGASSGSVAKSSVATSTTIDIAPIRANYGTNAVNESSQNYVMYLFAHDAGGFGPAGTDNVITCGSYTGNASTAGPVVTLGYEPQWVLIKGTTAATQQWFIFDTMRGIVTESVISVGDDPYLLANTSAAETSSGISWLSVTSTGFQITSGNSNLNGNGENYIYIAIRRGPMKTPTSGTSVYNAISRTGTGASTAVTGVGFSPDLALIRCKDGRATDWFSKLIGFPVLRSASATEEVAQTTELTAWGMDGVSFGASLNTAETNPNNVSIINWYFRRAPGFCDVVCYTGTGANRTVSHNLQVVPELMIVKRRDIAADWWVYNSVTGNTNYQVLNSTAASVTSSTAWNNTSPTSSVFTVGTGAPVNASGGTYVAYLFAAVGGVSKVGSYTGNGSSQTINCGFAAGARFILIKRTDSTGDWYVWDTARGIVSGNDPRLSLNSTAAEVTTDDSIDPDNSGFIVNQLSATNINVSSATYIYLAIA